MRPIVGLVANAIETGSCEHYILNLRAVVCGLCVDALPLNDLLASDVMSDSLSSNTQLRFCLSDLEHKDLSEQAAASLSALLCSQVDEQHQVSNSQISLLLKGMLVE